MAMKGHRIFPSAAAAQAGGIWACILSRLLPAMLWNTAVGKNFLILSVSDTGETYYGESGMKRKEAKA